MQILLIYLFSPFDTVTRITIMFLLCTVPKGDNHIKRNIMVCAFKKEKPVVCRWVDLSLSSCSNYPNLTTCDTSISYFFFNIRDRPMGLT